MRSGLIVIATWAVLSAAGQLQEIQRAPEEQQWLVMNDRICCRGAVPFQSLEKELPLGLAVSPAPKKGKACSLSNLRKGTAELPDAPPAPLHLLFKHQHEHDHRYDRNFPPEKIPTRGSIGKFSN